MSVWLKGAKRDITLRVNGFAVDRRLRDSSHPARNHRLEYRARMRWLRALVRCLNDRRSKGRSTAEDSWILPLHGFDLDVDWRNYIWLILLAVTIRHGRSAPYERDHIPTLPFSHVPLTIGCSSCLDRNGVGCAVLRVVRLLTDETKQQFLIRPRKSPPFIYFNSLLTQEKNRRKNSPSSSSPSVSRVAPHNSRRGIVSCFTGARRDLAQANRTNPWPLVRHDRTYKQAPYPDWLTSQNPWICISTLFGNTTCRGIVSSLIWGNWFAIACHFVCNSEGPFRRIRHLTSNSLE